MSDLFRRSVDAIEKEYARLGYQAGWRFLLTPRSTLTSTAEVVFISLNPGGEVDDPEYPRESCEYGSAYVHEAWSIPGQVPRRYPQGQAPLQQQVQAMFRWLRRESLIDATLSAYFIPFRSQSFERLGVPEAARQFAIGLWREIFAEVKPELIVCLGNHADAGLRDVWGTPRTSDNLGVGWGSATATVASYRERVLLRLPHLSRYKIFDRSESAIALDAIALKVKQRRAEVKQHRTGLA